MKTITFIIGLSAAVISTTAFFPQVVKAHNTKHTKDISLAMYILLVVGFSLWLAYGILLVDWPIILANIVTLVANIYLIYLKLKYG